MIAKNIVTGLIFFLLMLLFLPAAECAAMAFGFFLGGLLADYVARELRP